MEFIRLRNLLPSLNIEKPSTKNALLNEYLKFYDLDFNKKFDGLDHFFGKLKCQKYSIACHFYKLNTAKKTCFLVHGYTDHAGLYRKLINDILSKNYNVVIIDLPGHGLSSGERLDIKDFNIYIDVVKESIEFFNERNFPPSAIVGQSMGGAIAMSLILRESVLPGYKPFKRVILLAPLVRIYGWYRLNIASSILIKFIKMIKREFNINSHDESFLNFIKNTDPLQEKKVPLRWVRSMFSWEKQFQEFNNIDLDCLVVQGDNDDTVDWRYNIKLIKEKFSGARVEIISDARHHLACENDEYYSKVSDLCSNYLD